MLGKCKMTGNEKMFPCSAAGCPLFGDCLVEYEKEHKKNTAKPQTNADRIRAMSDELLATQFTQVVKETIKVLTNLDVPDELSNEIRSNLLEKLKQPADMRGEEE